MQVHRDERDRKRRSKYKVKYSMQITVTVVEGTSLCRKSMGGPRHLTFLLPPLKPFILREWSWLLSTHSDLVVSLVQRSLCQHHRSISLTSLIGKTMEIYIYIHTVIRYRHFHRYNRSRVYLSFRTTLIFWYDVTIVFAPFIFCGFGMKVSSNTGFAPFIPPRQW